MIKSIDINALVNVHIEMEEDKPQARMSLEDFLAQDFNDYEDFESEFLAYLEEN